MMDEAQVRSFIAQSEMLRTWKIEDVLGRGRKSVVYQIARDTGEEKAISALKVICVMPDPDEVKYLESIGLTSRAIEQKYKNRIARCRDEIRIMQQLQGEAYILNCLDFEEVKVEGKPGGLLMIREEKLTPLKDVFSKYPLNERKAVQIALCVARALDICHCHQSKPIVHGDVKPDNIFWLRDDIYKLGDFGVSAFISEVGAQKQEGTPFYDAPEKKSGDITPKTDIYALGRTIYRLLERKEHNSEAERNRPLWRLAAQMTAVNPADRPADIKEVIERLERIQTDTVMQWTYQQWESATETQTDSLASRVYRQSENESIIPDWPEKTAVHSDDDASSKPDRSIEISDELQTSMQRRFAKERKLKRKRQIAVGAAVVVLLAAGVTLYLCSQRKGTVNDVSVEFSMQKDPTDYGLITGLLYSYPKECGFEGRDKHDALMREALLTRIIGGTNLPITQLRRDGLGVYIHLTAANGFPDTMDSCRVAIRCGKEEVFTTVDAGNGDCGIFGQKLLYLSLDSLLSQAGDALSPGQNYELLVFSAKGLLFRMEGKIN